ncbi:unnamed protein product [Vicia faba]|uniref:Uncharacterized protein n=1 Tax=Vicia faba TaxID=3906 RepID=A0AAV1A0X1_VICFA|nr:unnamed protein product [Vicia faba]
MASLVTNFSGFVLFFPIGIHRLLSSSSFYLQNPSHFRSKLWYFSDPKWKNLDLYLLLIALPLASFSELFLFLSFSHHPTYRFSFFQQSFAVLAFWVLIILIIVIEYVNSCFVTENFVFIFGGVVFLMEYSVMEKGISGVAAVVYGLLGGLTLVCAFTCFYLSVKPSAFFAEFLLSCGLVFKGTWLLQIGFSLYTNTFGLKGCQKISILSLTPQMDNVDVVCDLEEDSLRGAAMMELLFILHAVLVLILGFALFGVSASKRNLRCGEVKGPLLSELESTSTRMCDLEMG